MIFEALWKEFSALPEITAIALGGSRATGRYDKKSDYDLYLYCTALPDDAVRARLLERYCSYVELGNRYWETEDDCTLNDGVDIDILYRDIRDFEGGLAAVVEDCRAGNGYTTCMWHNLLTCQILYDEDGALTALKERFTVPYPEALRRSIIERNLRLLHGYLPSYDAQIMKAANRGDLVAVNHRVAAFLESYFDIIFAFNRLTHPGEKRMLEIALREADRLPDDFEENIRGLLAAVFGEPALLREALDRILYALSARIACD